MKPKPRCVVCGLVKSAPSHGGSLWEHDYEGEARPRFGDNRQRINQIGERGAERRDRWQDAKARHLAMQPTCQGSESGLPGPCSGVIDVHHIIPRGLGGGRDYGEYVTLCRKHHQWVEMNREAGRQAGLLKKPPTSTWAPLFTDDED